MALKQRTLVYGVVTLGILAAVIAGVALRRPVLRVWYAWNLDSPEVAKEEKWRFVEGALGVGGEREVEKWCLTQLRSRDGEHQRRVATTLAAVGSDRAVLPLLSSVESAKRPAAAKRHRLVSPTIDPLEEYPRQRLHEFLSRFGDLGGVLWLGRSGRLSIGTWNPGFVTRLVVIRTALRGIGRQAIAPLVEIARDWSSPPARCQLAMLELHTVIQQLHRQEDVRGPH